MVNTRPSHLQARCTWNRQAHCSVIVLGLLLCTSRHDVSAFVAPKPSHHWAHTPSPITIRFPAPGSRASTKLHAQLIEEGKAWLGLTPNLVLDNTELVPATAQKASIPNLTVSLVKSVVGGGVLALPAAVAALGDAPDAVLPVAVSLIVGVGDQFLFLQLDGQSLLVDRSNDVCGRLGKVGRQRIESDGGWSRQHQDSVGMPRLQHDSRRLLPVSGCDSRLFGRIEDRCSSGRDWDSALAFMPNEGFELTHAIQPSWYRWVCRDRRCHGCKKSGWKLQSHESSHGRRGKLFARLG
jgi:hypothetical protein